MNIKQKVALLRSIMKKKNLSAYIVNSKDSHDSEYTASYWQGLEFITGFTGGEGTAVISQKEALIWVDSRYFIQCNDEIKGTCFKMKKIDGPDAESIVDYLKSRFSVNDKIGINAQTLSISEFRKLKNASLNIKPCKDLLDGIWKDRPAFPETEVYNQNNTYVGAGSKEKLAKIREEMKKDGADYHLVSSLDDIAWILNLRASDLDYVPVFYSYLLIGKKKNVLFTSENRFKNLKTTDLPFEIMGYDEVFDELKKLSGTIVINPNRINVSLYSSVRKMKIVEKREYSSDFKMIKQGGEVTGMLKSQADDTVAAVETLYYISKHGKDLSEKVISDYIEQKKKECSKEYEGPSFATICAYKENGAVVHYRTDEKHDRKIEGNGLLVLDCGSQYESGTTDFTRTLLFGKPTKEQIKYYTAVLKAHLKLQMTVFPAGTTAMQLDSLARAEVWKVFQNYYHGTGHGVGSHLSVHEGPVGISSRGSDTELKEGMVLTDEPGIYIEGRFGIRIENMVYVDRYEDDDCKFFRLTPMTYIPYERKLIDKDSLTEKEIAFINEYHKKIFGMFGNMLSEGAAQYLKEITKPL